MDAYAWLEKEIDRTLIALLIACKLPEMEKRVILNTIPYMKEAEKKELERLLEEEVNYEIDTSEAAMKEFVAALSGGAGQAPAQA